MPNATSLKEAGGPGNAARSCPAWAGPGAALAVALLLLVFPGTAAADLVVSYEAGAIAPTLVLGGVTASDFGVGDSTVLTGFTELSPGGNPGYAFEASNWTTSGTPDLNSAFVFTLQSNSYDMTLTGIALDVRPQGSGPQQISIGYVINGGSLQTFSAPEYTPAAQSENIDVFTNWATLPFTGEVAVPAGSNITFVLMGYDAKGTDKSLQVDNVFVSGSIIPEPATGSLAACGILFFGAHRLLRRGGVK